MVGAKRADEFCGKLVRVEMSVVETMDPEYYPGAVQDHTGQWRCSKYGSNGSALQNGTPKKVAYWERIPVLVQRVPGAAEWCHGRGEAFMMFSLRLNPFIVYKPFANGI